MALRLAALHAGRALPPRKMLILIFVGMLSRSQNRNEPARIRSIEKEVNVLIEIRSLDLPACSIVPQPISYREMKKGKMVLRSINVLFWVSVKDIGGNISQQAGKAEIIEVSAGNT
jgi:hypothetical protein